MENILTILTTGERKKLAEESRSPDILFLLSKDPDFNVREKVAANDSTLSETLDILAKDPNICVLFEVILNSNTSVMALKFLSSSSNKYIREAAEKRLSSFKKK